MSKKTFEQRIAEADRESRAVLKQLQREQEHEEALAAARNALARVNRAADLERLTAGELADAERLAPDEYAAMRSRVIDSLPAARRMAVKMQDQLANPRQPQPPEPPSDEQLAAAVAAGALPISMTGSLSNAQVAQLKRDHRDLYWKATRALADAGDKAYAVVQK